MRFLMLVLIFMAVFTTALPASQKNVTCSPWKGRCHVTEDCCRHLVCLTYQAKCVPYPGELPGDDTRPIGDGPFPPFPNITQTL
ncbi:hypothetical protein WN48_07086 [Eufriesea mexicana]|uniref:Uncharacterized protein n=1 Tax=Eufriesea mexicana TaxID=516756 RepID=A0A310SXL7_9HYME|nr:PREDICTED: uncharacterized protein LOC108554875 [Eufriesea mexicana]OAD62836.1 hypothetical protein WN48_07086 [Eufriesea mexicana]